MESGATNGNLPAAVQAIDTANEGDPTHIDLDGVATPLALAEGRAASEWVLRLREGHSTPDALQIAARGHHLRRWELPRDEYPRDRQGYLAWRTRLYGLTADHLAGIMDTAGYTTDDIALMNRLLHKRGIKNDPDVQTYEDAVSLAFLEIQFPPFARRTPRETMVRALRRTWRKMSEDGHQAALTLSLADDLLELVQEAIAVPASAPHTTDPDEEGN